jgi:adenine-specific DNA-methyltransferase
MLATGNIEPMPPYEDVIRPFAIDAAKEFTDVWTFPSVRPYKGKHPAEKPALMLEHAIEATTFPDDIVLDCFAGSGSTTLAALKLKRRSISMEIDPMWVSRIAERLQLYATDNLAEVSEIGSLAVNSLHKVPQLPLFVAGK